MSPSIDRISRRTALQRAVIGSIAPAAAIAALPSKVGASILAPSAMPGAERLLMVFLRDPSLTGADELAFFHGSTTRLEPSLGAWLVHAKGTREGLTPGLQCVEQSPQTSVRRLCYAGPLPIACRGEVLLSVPSLDACGARAIQALLPADAAFSLAAYSREQDLRSKRCLLVLAGTRERIHASAQESFDRSVPGAPLQLAGSSLHILLHGAAVRSRTGPESVTAGNLIQRIQPADLHATVLAGMGVDARRLHIGIDGRTMRPLAATGRMIPGVYV